MIRPELGTVQETLLLPLIGRAEISRRRSNLFNDKKAEEIIGQLDFNKKRAQRNMGEAGMLGMAVRALKMDKAIRDFVYHHPNATILNIGAGLDTAFWRVDNGRLRWFDLDLPDSIRLRNQFLPEGDRNRFISKSMFEYSWIDDLGDISDGLFIQVPGVLPYLEKQAVIDFFEHVSPRLPGTEIIFDVISELSAYFVNNAVNRSGMKGTRMDWGITDARKMTQWSPHIEVISQQGYFEDIDRKWSYLPTTNLLMYANDLFKVAQFFHLRFI
ncbi:MAG: class I SAM-dependent methyltransferase [Bacteroidetes bacterium]|nr:class I SAM-dependent methyltransferase [Bacteroidota bacterium]